ncbi:hypothetical protein [Nostoc cycadae]|uniref:C-5 cytosine-specific DNA methylase n=1 Tax=Nostoc cycadae WK-1 TaxID=1861711 RepID=A0A2H6LRA0_9NOSO|nr:hypothetical protein [Nostoc cycadae]GBE95730.1 C-5 cytosine-specific DNA methylase [Nostoc cycadae WK-1]
MAKYAVGDTFSNPFKVGKRIVTPFRKIGCISSVHKKITITWENGYSSDYTPDQLQAWNYSLEDETSVNNSAIATDFGKKQFWRSTSGLHPVPSSVYESIVSEDNRFIRCDNLPIHEQIELCNKRISQQQGRIKDLQHNCKSKKEKDKAIAISQTIIDEENQRIEKLNLMPNIERTQESEPIVLCPSCRLQHIYLSGGCGICGLEPEIHQETKPKKQPKGCLYSYIERKKLKDGSVIEYPRVEAGERDPDNPLHWRWGFNWEEKINNKWKGRSIGSIPPDLILDIKLMQLDGASLEEIIKFIKLSKSKK